MPIRTYLFTSESVSEGHPDKVCDRISDEIVDLFFKEASKAGMAAAQVRVAAETLATTNYVCIAGEVRTSLTEKQMKSKVKSAARRAIRSIGYEQAGFSLAQLKVMQEVITMAVFAAFALLYMREKLTMNFVYAGICLVAAAWFMFRDFKPAA